MMIHELEIQGCPVMKGEGDCKGPGPLGMYEVHVTGTLSCRDIVKREMETVPAPSQAGAHDLQGAVRLLVARDSVVGNLEARWREVSSWVKPLALQGPLQDVEAALKLMLV